MKAIKAAFVFIIALTLLTGTALTLDAFSVEECEEPICWIEECLIIRDMIGQTDRPEDNDLDCMTLYHFYCLERGQNTSDDIPVMLKPTNCSEMYQKYGGKCGPMEGP